MNRRNVSMLASIIVTTMLLALVVVAVFMIPQIMQVYSKMRGGIDVTSLMVALYISSIPGLICTLSLLKLLFNISSFNFNTSYLIYRIQNGI